MQHGVFVNVMDTLERLQSSHNFGGIGRPQDGEKIKLGICSMDKKARSKPMREIVSRMNSACEVLVFGNDTILNKPIEEWPRCHCLIAFHSDGFPLDKADAYAKKYKPFLINQIHPQHYLKDRRHVYRLLKEAGVPVPKHLVVSRGTDSPSGIPVANSTESNADLVEGDDYIEVDGVRLNKPFMEKPVAGDDHNIYLYYPRAEGGGHKRLFRKIGNRSSEFYPDESNVRRNGSFIYEEFLATEGTDVKVYAVTGQYAHAEARKSPVVDGKVIRDTSGHEIRYPIMLSSYEKELARRVTSVFGQRVCGFDMLRSNGKSFVCDVNGWSFVKKSFKYYDDTAAILTRLMRKALGIQLYSPSPTKFLTTSGAGVSDLDDDDEEGTTDNETSSVGGSVHEELRCVIGVIRHGDRTPKQKLKMVVSNERFLALYHKYAQPGKQAEVKLKSAVQLGDVLSATREVLELVTRAHGTCEDDSDTEFGAVAKLSQMKTVLEMHGRFKGVNRKVQLKPLTWRTLPDAKPEASASGAKTSANKRVVELQLILKWGGVLTPFGREAAEQIGRSFRTQVYPGTDGLIRLHSTYRHDLKIYSSDEGRVQVTAAAFAKGLLDLEGHLTPILASLVRKSSDVNKLLDDASAAQERMTEAKEELKKMLNSGRTLQEELEEREEPCKLAQSVTESVESIGIPRKAMEDLHRAIKMFAMQFRLWLRRAKGGYGLSDVNELQSTDVESSENSEGGSAAFSLGFFPGQNVNGQITLQFLELGYARWSKLDREFFNRKKQVYDISKIPDIYDCAKFDTVHNPLLLDMEPFHLRNIFHLSKSLADFVVPQEYGFTWRDKFEIGGKICGPLLQKIHADLQNSVDHILKLSSKEEDETVFRLDKRYAKAMGIKSRERHVRTRLYFTSESHLHALLNVLRFAGQVDENRSGTPAAPPRNAGDAQEDGDTDTSDSEDSRIPSPMLSAVRRIEKMAELGYLTHIVFRLYEIKVSGAQNTSMSRFRVAVSVSDGVSVDVGPCPAPMRGSEPNPPPEPALATVRESGGESSTASGGSASGENPGEVADDESDEDCGRSSRSASSGSDEEFQFQSSAEEKRKARAASPSSAVLQKTTPFKLHMEPANPMTTLWQDIPLTKLMELFQSVTGSVSEPQLRTINVQRQISVMMNLPPAVPGATTELDGALMALPEDAALATVSPHGS